MKLHIGLNQDLIEYRIKKEVLWDTQINAMGILQGATGTGKTFALDRMLGYCEFDLEKQKESATVILYDFKGDDSFKAYRGCNNYYAFMGCLDAIERFYNIFVERQQGNPDRTFVLMCFDEYASFLTALEKKEQDVIKRKFQFV